MCLAVVLAVRPGLDIEQVDDREPPPTEVEHLTIHQRRARIARPAPRRASSAPPVADRHSPVAQVEGVEVARVHPPRRLEHLADLLATSPPGPAAPSRSSPRARGSRAPVAARGPARRRAARTARRTAAPTSGAAVACGVPPHQAPGSGSCAEAGRVRRGPGPRSRPPRPVAEPPSPSPSPRPTSRAPASMIRCSIVEVDGRGHVKAVARRTPPRSARLHRASGRHHLRLADRMDDDAEHGRAAGETRAPCSHVFPGVTTVTPAPYGPVDKVVGERDRAQIDGRPRSGSPAIRVGNQIGVDRAHNPDSVPQPS